MVLREWGRIGLTGFGGPPAHIALLRQAGRRPRGLDGPTHEFEDANRRLQPPARARPRPSWRSSAPTGWRVPPGAMVGGLGFIVPAVVLILSCRWSSSRRLAARLDPRRRAPARAPPSPRSPSRRRSDLLGPSWRRTRREGADAAARRWVAYVARRRRAAAPIGPYLVLVLLGCGGARDRRAAGGSSSSRAAPRRGRWRCRCCAAAAVSAGSSATWSGRRSRSAPSPSAAAS